MVERARQRKEEEEKRFQESKQMAAKKLKNLEMKIKEKLRDSDKDDSTQGESPSSSNPPEIPRLDHRDRTRTISEDKDDKAQQSAGDQFRQIDRAPYMRRSDEQMAPPGVGRPGDRDRDIGRGVGPSEAPRDMREPAFSRHFQSNLPPRFQKQQAERGGTGPGGGIAGGTGGLGGVGTGLGSGGFNRVSPISERVQSGSFNQQYDPSRWSHNHPNSLSTCRFKNKGDMS